MKTVFRTKGTCSQAIELDVDEDKKTIRSVHFIGGCPGNSYGLAQMVAGQSVDDVIQRLEGITCGMKSTSCPDQLALALRQLVNGDKSL